MLKDQKTRKPAEPLARLKQRCLMHTTGSEIVWNREWSTSLTLGQRQREAEVLVRTEEITAVTEESSSEQPGKNEVWNFFDMENIFYTPV